MNAGEIAGRPVQGALLAWLARIRRGLTPGPSAMPVT